MKTFPDQTYVYKTIKSPVGALKLVGSDRGLAAILWEKDPLTRAGLLIRGEDADEPTLLKAEQELGEYFAGKRQKFSVKLDFHGTAFQKKVWNALRTIPYGKTVSYGEIAKRIGQPNVSRAVGRANNKNPICIMAACHRVVGASGALTGYAGGLEAKLMLLELEGSKVFNKQVLTPSSKVV